MFGKPPRKKHVVLAGLAAVALLLGMAGTAVRSDKAQAKPNNVLTFSPNVCIALMRVIEGDCNADGAYTAGECDAACAAGLSTPGGLNALARALGADVSPAVVAPEPWNLCGNGLDDDVDTIVDDGCADDYNDPDLFQELADLSGAQLGDYSVANPVMSDGKLWVMAFVSNDENVDFEADEGVFLSSGTSTATCNAEQDCDNDGVEGDGIVVDLLLGVGVADRGDAELVVTQAGVDVIIDYVVVGDPDEIAVALVPDGTVQEGIEAADCADDPHLTPLDSSVFTDGVAEPEKNGLTAVVTDDDDTELAGVFVDWASDDEDVANLNLDTSITWALESGTFAENLFCGDAMGTATITADIGVDDDFVDVTVIGVPDAMTLSASPASMVCDGVNSSTVTADLVDREGNPVVDGTRVRFDVTCLGIADPITARTTDGTATSHITPLSGVSAGVVVLVSVRDVDLEGNIRIDCASPPPALTGDVNCSGDVTMVDAMLVAQYVVGLIDEFPCNVSPPP